LSKLFFFSVLLFLLPLSSYYGTQKYLFGGKNDIYSAIIAIVLANLVLLGYVVAAIIEDREEEEKSKVL